MDQKQMDRVARATVRLMPQERRGVLVPGQFILTAAQCLFWKGTLMMQRDLHERIQASDGIELTGACCAVEPVADIAVLGAPNDQVMPSDYKAWLEFFGRADPVPLSTPKLGIGQSQSVSIFRQHEEWVPATMTRVGLPGPAEGRFAIESDHPILAGDAGSPVVDDAGHLVGVVPEVPKGGSGPHAGHLPVACYALPRWVLDRIRAATPRTTR
jgi:hypothetical protein